MIIIGLGNPDKKYLDTYHNVGFMVVDKLAAQLDTKFKTNECKAVTATLYSGGERVVIAKPITYMNLSGEAAAELIGKYKGFPEEIIVIYDDIDLPVGDLRVRKEGSGGTHNGMKNIIEILGTKNIPRLRVGIGKAPENVPLANYVLGRVSGINKDILDKACQRATTCLAQYVADKNLDKLMRDISIQNNI